MATPPDREQFLRHGDEQWAALEARLGDRTDDELLRPGASGPHWSGKDVLAHLARWHDHALAGIRAIVEGREPISRSNFDQWNARWFEEDGSIDIAEARRRHHDSRAALRNFLAGLDHAQWDETIHGWADANMNGHYQEHLDEFTKVTWPD